MNAIQYHLIIDSYDQCYQSGNYKGIDCESCPHKNECSGYENHDKEDNE